MAKVLLSGNEAIARGAYEAGVKVASAYPGTPSTEIFENLPLYKDAPKVTLFTAASITGMPTLAADYRSFRLYATGNTVRFGSHKGTTILFR